MMLIVWGMVRERIGNHHVTEHSERHGLILAILALVVTALVVQLVAQGPVEMIALTCAAIATLVSVAVWTSMVGIKASVHMGVWCGVVAIFAVGLSPWWWTGLALAPAIAWSRMQLGHHTSREIAVGAATGLAIAPVDLPRGREPRLLGGALRFVGADAGVIGVVRAGGGCHVVRS